MPNSNNKLQGPVTPKIERNRTKMCKEFCRISHKKVVDCFVAGCIIPDVAGGADAQTSARLKRQPSNSKLIVPASASSAADRAPRSRYLRAGTALLNPRSSSQPRPAPIQSWLARDRESVV